MASPRQRHFRASWRQVSNHVSTARAFREKSTVRMCVEGSWGQSTTLVIINSAEALHETGHGALACFVQTGCTFSRPQIYPILLYELQHILSGLSQTEGQVQGWSL